MEKFSNKVFYLLILSVFCHLNIYAQNEQINVSKQDVVNIITKVNRYWQKRTSYKVRSFWDHAAYHTGNMEAYKLTKLEEFRLYSENWAEHNQWKGAKSDVKENWKYNYGETDYFVLFGDWQICFQTYIDLYNLDKKKDEKKIARAKEVMEYQMSTPNNDYWWWADGLYMVMPVMTKMYNLTGNKQYLDKLYEYFKFADDLMYDKQEMLYYRDGKYVFPKEPTTNGLKNFWARGDGWVFAGLAKVLQDLPKNNEHRDFYIDRFTSMAKAIKKTQQAEGYWTRSMLDPKHTPGRETSGTAFFTYGLFWGINNEYLKKEEYQETAIKAWNYLQNIGMQNDGSIGYVQPIGEKAIPGQTVNSSSTANFGVGAFLLAACELYRYLDKNKQASNIQNMEGVQDRKYWTDLLYKMSEPVLSSMSKGELAKNMELELSPTWDGRNKKVAYMECFGRLMAGLAPWLSLPDDDTEEGKKRKHLRNLALKSYAHAVDPNSPDYLGWSSHGQALVDAAYIANSFLRAPEQLWDPLDAETKKRYITEFQGLRRYTPVYSNWVLFVGMIETFLMSVGEQYDAYRVDISLRKTEEWYVGDSWYSDGSHFAFDYYNSYVIQPMYVEILQAFHKSKKSPRVNDARLNTATTRMQRYAEIMERFISPEGSFPVVGRSMTYRMGVFQPLALLSWQNNLPSELTQGQVRTAMTSVMKRMFSNPDNFNTKGFLKLGFVGHQPGLADVYTNNGSAYITSLTFLPLGLPTYHPFWTSKAQDWTAKKAWGGVEFPKDKSI